MDTYAEILKQLGGMAMVLAAVAWLVRSLTVHFLSKDAARYKERLKASSDLELEKLRADLTRQTLEHNVKFRRIDEKIAEHLLGVYQRLFDLYESVHNYVKIAERSDEPTKEEKLAVVIKANDLFYNYLLHNRPYIPPKMYKQVKETADLLASISREFTDGRDMEKKGITTESSQPGHWWKAYIECKEKATPMFSALVGEIQRRLGVFDPNDSPHTSAK